MSFGDIGKSFTFPDEKDAFREHVKSRGLFSGCKGITFHHTASPNLENRPNGLTDQHIRNIRDYYQSKGWASGPHLFVDDHRVMCMSPLNTRGIHAKSFNGSHIGIEVLGDYDSESPEDGRGLLAWTNTAAAANIIMEATSLTKWNFHRDDPLTDKTCPGTKIKTAFVRDLLAITGPPPEAPPAPPVKSGVMAEATITVRQDENWRFIAPIGATLAALGMDGAYDSGNWRGINIAFYDEETETSYAELGQLLAVLADRGKKG